jgi:hypothetical protein
MTTDPSGTIPPGTIPSGTIPRFRKTLLPIRYNSLMTFGDAIFRRTIHKRKPSGAFLIA